MQAVLNSDAGRDDEKAASEILAAGTADGIDGLPGDQHRHDRCFPGAGGQFQGQAHQFRIRFVVGVVHMLQKRVACLAGFGATSVSQIAASAASIWQKNGRMPANWWCPPVLEEPRGLRA